MATAAKLVVDEPASTSIATIVAQTPAVVLTDEAQREALYEHIQREIDAFEPDVSTLKGREAIKSLAYKITRTKTAIDAAGKQLNEEARARINAVDAERRAAKEKLGAMAEQVRKPLTDWEEAEKARIAWADELIATFQAGSIVTLDDTAASVRERGAKAWNVIVSEETLGDKHPEVQAAKDVCVQTLKAALARLTREEEERAELERLRAESAAREAREREEQEARERAEREAAEAAAAEERRVAAEKAEAERTERIAREAEERALREAEEAAQAERERVQREHEEALAAERRRAEQAEAEAQAERDRIAKEDADRRARDEKAAAEKAQREADQANRTKVKTAAKQAIMSCGADEETARKIVMAIIAGEVPHVTLEF